MHKQIPRAWVRKMKKILVMLCAIFGLTLGTFAETVKTCKISGSNDGATIMASVIEVGDGYVEVEFSNDGTISANVRVTVIDRSTNKTGSTGAIVAPQQTVVKKIQITTAESSDSIDKFEIKALSGNRCS